MGNDHTVKSYDQQLNLLTRKICEMGGLVEQQLASAIEALANRNIELAARVIEHDDRVDDLEEDLESESRGEQPRAPEPDLGEAGEAAVGEGDDDDRDDDRDHVHEHVGTVAGSP